MSGVEVTIKRFEALELSELHDIFWIRNLVFVVGQGITAEPEVDGRDPECSHALVRVGGKVVGTARVFDRRRPCVVGRVAVLEAFRGRGLGRAMMQVIQEKFGAGGAELHAQAHLEAWYGGLGWRRVGEAFVEAGIPHVTMVYGALRGPGSALF